MEKYQIIDEIVKQKLNQENTGHGYNHAVRVLNNAIYIAKENKKTDLDILKISCLLHDIAYQKKCLLKRLDNIIL